MIRAAAFAVAALACGARADALPEVCPEPQEPCGAFKPHDLPFVREADGKARGEELSAPFLAVILKSAPPCTLGEPERGEAQAVFPRKKVFVLRFECDGDAENNVTYTNVDPRHAFVAVYAGRTREEAEETLAVARLTGRYPDANLRRMQVRFVSP